MTNADSRNRIVLGLTYFSANIIFAWLPTVAHPSVGIGGNRSRNAEMPRALDNIVAPMTTESLEGAFTAIHVADREQNIVRSNHQ